MRTRIKFAKYDTMRFIGHLDVMRYFQRMIRRSGLPVKYSEGFHPHQLLSFAQPLGLGLTSDGEYADVEFEEELDTEYIKSELLKAATTGIDILEVTRLRDRENNRRLVTSMSLINRSVYGVILKDREGTDYKLKKNILSEGFAGFLALESINIIKKTKKSEKEIDLKPFIYEFCDYTGGELKTVYASENAKKIVTEDTAAAGLAHAPEFDNDIKFIVSLSAGSEMNIPPDLFLNTALEHIFRNETRAEKPDSGDFRIHRMELLGGDPAESEPLSCLIQ